MAILLAAGAAILVAFAIIKAVDLAEEESAIKRNETESKDGKPWP